MTCTVLAMATERTDLEREGRRDALVCLAFAWFVALVVVSPVPLLVGGWPAVVGIGAAALGLPAVIATVPLHRAARFPLARLRALPPATQLANLVDGALVRRGEDRAQVEVWTAEAEHPNVGAFPLPGGRLAVVATTGAARLLTRAELETQVFAQLSIARDRWAKLASRATLVTRIVPLIGGLEFVGGFPLVFLLGAAGQAPGRLIAMLPLGFGAMFLALIRAPYLDRRRASAADAAAALLTSNPPALVSSLDKLANTAFSRMRLGWTMFADPFLAVPAEKDTKTTVNGKVRTDDTETYAVLRARAGRVARWTGVPYRTDGTVEAMEDDWYHGER